MDLKTQRICFVSMPFGIKQSVDFDAVYTEGIIPAVRRAGATSIRADTDVSKEFYAKPLFERLLRSDVLIADVTAASPNVFYELGIRHAAKSHGTILIMAASDRVVPFDLATQRILFYEIENQRVSPQSLDGFQKSLADKIALNLSGRGETDSPLFSLFDAFPGIELQIPAAADLFINYAREDETAVHDLYDVLSQKGFRPWLDKRDIKPGEQWELAIEGAMRKADFILVCLSQLSVQKRGYLRREMRAAIRQAEEMLDTDIYLVPVRLDECDVPKELSKFQWVDVFKTDGPDRLIEAIQEGLRRRRGEKADVRSTS